MVRGCQRRVIFIKNTGSEVFSEAYFIVDDKHKSGSHSESDMIKEAKRIIDESVVYTRTPKREHIKGKKALMTALSMLPAFILGVILTSAVFMMFII